MKLAISILPLLASRSNATANDVRPDIEDDMVQLHLKCNYGFVTGSDTDEAPQYDEQVVTQCLEDSYNEYHDATKSSVDGVEVGKKVVYELPAELSRVHQSDDIEFNFFFYSGHWAYLYGSFCTFCSTYEDDPFNVEEGDAPEIQVKDDQEYKDYSVDVGSSHPHPEWELRFCSCLQQSGEAGLATAYDCRIHRADAPDQQLGISKVFQSNGIYPAQGAKMLVAKALA